MLLSDLPKELVIEILSYTGRKHESDAVVDEDDDEVTSHTYPERRDILSLYCTCHGFSLLAHLHLVVTEDDDYTPSFVTIDIFGRNNGLCLLLGGSFDSKLLRGMEYLDNTRYDILTRSEIDKHVGDHIKMVVCGNDGYMLANSLPYENMGDEFDKVLSDVHEQLLTMDPEFMSFVSENILLDTQEYFIDRDHRSRVMLVREKVPSNTVKVSVPENWKVDEGWLKYL